MQTGYAATPRLGKPSALRWGVLLLGVTAGALWLALRPPQVPVPPISEHVFADVTLVEPGRGRRAGRTLRVRGDAIVEVRAFRPGGEAEQEAIPELAGGFALPGLIDLHVHHPPRFAPGERALAGLLFLAHGVTSVRDTGSLWGDALELREAVREGRHPGPRVFACGPFLDGPDPIWPGSRVVRDAAEGAAAVGELAAAGYDCAKLYNGLSRDAVQGILRAAQQHGLPVVGHVPHALPLAALHGVEVQHLMGTTEHWVALEPADVELAVRVSQSNELAHTPTLVAFARAARLDDHESLRRDPMARLLPRYYRDLLWNPETHPDIVALLAPAGFGNLDARVDHMQRMARRLHAAGVPVLAGTDTLNPFVVPGAALHEELSLLAEAGLGPEGAWAAATRGAGRALGVPRLGTLTPGAPADLLIFREDPTRDLAALATLQAVVARGRLYPKPELDAALDRYRAHFDSPVYDTLSTTAARAALHWLAR